MTDAAAQTPPKHHRIGIFAPVILLALAAAGWSGYWFYVARQIESLIGRQQAGLIAQGYQVSVDPWKVGGFPFRMYVRLNKLTVIAPSGQGVATPRFEAEANAYALDKWVMIAPEGMTLYRGRHEGVDWGKIAVTGASLKASMSGLNQPVYRIALQGRDVKLAVSDPSRPFLFDSADNFEAYLRPTEAQTDSADVMLRLTSAHGQPGNVVGDLSPGKPLSLQVEGSLSKVSGFAFHDYAGTSGLEGWTAGGGQLKAMKAEINAGDLDIMAKSGALGFDADRRLTGHVDLDIKGTFKPVEVLGALHLISDENMALAKPLLGLTLATQGTQTIPLDFKEGSAYIGPLKVSRAPAMP